MEDYFADRSDQWQQSDRGDTHQERIQAIQEIVDALEAVWT
jgi:hypothetical protein